MKVADAIWVATALLHREHKQNPYADFAVREIVERAIQIDGYRPGLQTHATQHCVATKPPNPGRYRLLTETGRGRRRLFRDGDPSHPDRREGKVHPDPADLPQEYSELVEWYEHDFRHNGHRGTPAGTPGRDLVRFAGTLDNASAGEMTKAIEQGCERVDLNEW